LPNNVPVKGVKKNGVIRKLMVKPWVENSERITKEELKVNGNNKEVPNPLA